MIQTKEYLQKKLNNSVKDSNFAKWALRIITAILIIIILAIGLPIIFTVSTLVLETISTLPYFVEIPRSSYQVVTNATMALLVIILIGLIIYAIIGDKKRDLLYKQKIQSYLNDPSIMSEWETAVKIFSNSNTKIYESNNYLYIFDHLVSLENIFYKRDISSINFEFIRQYSASKFPIDSKHPHLFEIKINLMDRPNDPIYLIFHRDTIRTQEDLENNEVIKLLLNLAKHTQKLEIKYSALLADNRELINGWIARTQKI